MLIIGDVHGKTSYYHKLIQNEKESICVGDFGFKEEWIEIQNPLHKIIMGNHDYYPFLHTHPCSIGNSKTFKIQGKRVMLIRGANSIDKHLRTEGLDWFSNEELTYNQGLEVFDIYAEYKPEIVISHDCPQIVMQELFGYEDKSMTRNLLQACFEEHQPALWIFGHHHKSKNQIIGKTTFICLAELEVTRI